MVSMMAGRTERDREEENARRAYPNGEENSEIKGNLDQEKAREVHNKNNEGGVVQMAHRKDRGNSREEYQEERREVFEAERDEVDEFKVCEWVGRMSTVLKHMTVFTEEIASKVVRLGDGREVVMERFNSEREKAESLLRELEGAEVVDSELAEALDVAGIRTSDMMIRVLENGGKANDIVEDLELMLKVGEDVIVRKVGLLSEQVAGVAKVLGCEEMRCVLACEEMIDENNMLKKKLEKRNHVSDKIQNNMSVQRLLNRSCYSGHNDTLEIDGIGTDLRPLKASTPLGSKVSSPEGSFIGSHPEHREIQRAACEGGYDGDRSPKESVLESLLKAQVMPPIGDFYGSPDEDLERYLRVFMTRYNDQLFPDEILKDVLVEKLKGAAREVYLSLPDSARGLKFAEIVYHLKEGLKRDKRLDEVSAVGKMRMLKLMPGELLHYCNALEKLSLKAYPNMDPIDLSFIRSEQLYHQVAHWKDSLRLAEILENGSKSNMYNNMKDSALRMERLNNLRIRNNGRGYFVKEETRLSSQQHGLTASKGTECFNCGENGHRQFECRKPKTMQRPGNGPLRTVAHVAHQASSRPQTVTEMIREAAKDVSQDRIDAVCGQNPNRSYYVGGCQPMGERGNRRSVSDDVKPFHDNYRRTVSDAFKPFHDNYRRASRDNNRTTFYSYDTSSRTENNCTA